MIWKSVASVPGRGLYLNQLASIDTGIVANSFRGDRVYTTDMQFTDWQTWSVDRDATIANLASLNGKCYSFMKHQRSGSGEIAQFDVRTGMWHSLVTVAGDYQLVASETSLFLIGTSADGLVDEAMQIHKCDIIGKRLEYIYSLPAHVSMDSSLFSAVAIRDKIYMTGTSSSVSALNLFDSSTKLIPNTTNRNCTLLNFGGRLVASGGVGDSPGANASSHVEIFHPKLNRWLSLPPMSCNRVWHGVCTTNEYSVAVVGGMDQDILSSAEILCV